MKYHFLLFASICSLCFSNSLEYYKNCPLECETCITKSICTSCVKQYYLRDRKCLPCSIEDKLIICNSELFFDWTLHIESAKIIILKFNRKFENLESSSFFDKINIEIFPNMSNESYSIANINKKNDFELIININYRVSFRDKFLNISLNDPFFFFDSENNFLANQNLTNALPENLNYVEINEDVTRIFMYVFQSLMILVFFIMYFSDYFYIYWLLIDTIQTINIFYYFNVQYPRLLHVYLLALGKSNFDFFSNYFYEIFLKISGSDTLLLLNVPEKFIEAGKTESFIYNSGDVLLLFFAMLIILFFLIGFMRRHARVNLGLKNHKFTQESSQSLHSTVLMLVGRNLEWKVILKFLEIMNFNFLIGIFMKFNYCSFDNAYSIIDFSFTILFTLILGFILRSLFKNINNTSVFLGDREHYRKYGFLFENIDIKRFWARNFSLIIVFQKFFYCLLIFTLYSQGIAQILSIVGIQVLFTFFFLISFPFYDFFENIIFLIVQVMYIVVLLIIFGIKITYNKTLNQEFIEDDDVTKMSNLGIAAFSLSFFIILIHLGAFTWMAIRKNKEKNMNKSIEMNSVSGINSSKRTLADKYNL